MELQVGDIGNHKGILCKIVAQDGGKFTIETPHGTKIELGFAWLAASWRPLTAVERKIYDDYVQDAADTKHRLDLENVMWERD